MKVEKLVENRVFGRLSLFNFFFFLGRMSMTMRVFVDVEKNDFVLPRTA